MESVFLISVMGAEIFLAFFHRKDKISALMP